MVPLVKAVQELSSQNEKLKSQNDDLEQRVAKLEAMMNAQSSTNTKLQTTNISSATLEQNIPNPLNTNTSIHYNVPAGSSKALLNVTDNSGITVKHISLNGSGKGIVNIEASSLSAGIYSYTLIVDGKIIATKKMVIAR